MFERKETMIAYCVTTTRRDFGERLAYLSDNYDEACYMKQGIMQANPGRFLRSRVITLPVSREEAAEFWAKRGLSDGGWNLPCTLVPTIFAATYHKHFDAGRKEAAEG